jgi:hypothetical protein
MPRRAIRKTEIFEPVVKPRHKFRIRLPQPGFKAAIVVTLLTLVVFVQVIATTMEKPIRKIEYDVATLQAKRIHPTFSPTVAPTKVPTKTSTPTVVPTATKIFLPTPPAWFTLDQMTRYAGIVAGETWSMTDTVTLNFLATQILYDAAKYKGKLPVGRWKAYRQPTHDTLQAVNVALMNLDKPLWPKCKYIGGLNDSEYFQRVATGISMDYFFGNNKQAVVGWGCK